MTSQLNQFENDIFGLDAIIDIIFNRELKSFVNIVFEKYRDASLKVESSHKEIDGHIKISVKKCLLLISKSYMKKLYNTFSQDGLIYYIYSCFYNLFVSELENKINPT